MSSILISTTSFFRVIIKVHLLILGSFFLLPSCDEETVNKVPIEYLELKATEGRWYFDGEVFSGIAYKNLGKVLIEEVHFWKGKRNGSLKRWFLSGQLKYKAHYKMNKLYGKSSQWYANGQKKIESNFLNGVVEGIQRQWYPSGKIFKKMTIKNGREEGMQQAWWAICKLYNNYEAKNGRVFGLKRAKLCHELKKENLVK